MKNTQYDGAPGRLCRPAARQGQAGFSLIEIMVGLVIGILAVIIMMQVFSASEANKRATTGGDDAQINGTIALYGLERDIRMAGYGMSSFNLIGCSLSYTPSSESSAVTQTIAPVTINPAAAVVPAGDANTDTLLLMYGSSNSPSEGDALIVASTAGVYQVSTPNSFTTGDYLVAQANPKPSTCALSRDLVSNVTPASNTVSVTPGVAGLAAGGVIYNLGPAPVIRAYAIRNGNLTVCDYTAYNCGKSAYVTTLNNSVWVPIAGNIASLRIQYGRDGTSGTMVGTVNTYNQTTPGSAADTSGLTVGCSWARTMALRLAVVARSPQYDKTQPTSAAPTWAGTTAVTTGSPTNPTALAINLSSNTSWQYYRYKTLQTTVPLRNMIWQGGQPAYQGGSSGC